MNGLLDLACYIPADRITIASAQQELGISNDVLHTLTNSYGLSQFAVETRLNVHEMMEVAGGQLLSRNPQCLGKIDWILHTHTFNPFCPFLLEPLAAFQWKWGLHHAKVRCLSQMNCASMDMLFFIANALLSRNSADSILLLAADKMFLPSSRYLQDSTVSGDGAAAALITRSAAWHRLLGSSIHSDATLFNSVLSPPQDFAWFQKSFYMGLIKIFRAALKQAGLVKDQISFVFPSNVNQVTWKRIAEACEMPEDRFYFPTLSKVGHAHNADPLLNLEEAIRMGAIKEGDYYATLTVGMGNAFGCTIFQY